MTFLFILVPEAQLMIDVKVVRALVTLNLQNEKFGNFVSRIKKDYKITTKA